MNTFIDNEWSLILRTDVTNECDYIHHFCYENQEINEKLTDSLWHEMYLSTGESPKNNDENLQPNIPANSL